MRDVGVKEKEGLVWQALHRLGAKTAPEEHHVRLKHVDNDDKNEQQVCGLVVEVVPEKLQVICTRLQVRRLNSVLPCNAQQRQTHTCSSFNGDQGAR